LNHHFPELKEPVYIFDQTLEQMLNYDMGEGQKTPLLEELIAFAGKK
jgi:hypothetical protein